MEKERNLIIRIGKNILNILAAICIFGTGSFAGNTVEQWIADIRLRYILSAVIQTGSVLALGIFYCRSVLKMDLQEIGLTEKRTRPVWFAVAFGLPVVILLFYAGCVPGSILRRTENSVMESILYAIFEVGIPVGIVEEFIFRGIIFRYMEKTLGTLPAILIPSVLFASLHIMNMQRFEPVDVILLLFGGILVAVMFTMIALVSDSIWPGALVHAVWNALIIGRVFGVGEVVNGMKNCSLIQILPDNTSRLLTGGNFGIEAGVPAIIGYIAVILFCWNRMVLQKKNKYYENDRGNRDGS